MRHYGIIFRTLLVSLLLGSGRTAYAQVEPAEEKTDVSADSQPMALKPVAQFSCARTSTPEEDALDADLKGTDDQKKLMALKKLVSLSAPSSVSFQYQAFMDLKKKFADHDSVLSAAQAFDKKRITEVLAQEEGYSRDIHKFHWCMRAAGVLKIEEVIPQLVELSKSSSHETSLAAERTIEDFEGEKAEDALLQVISYWNYNAFERALEAMVKRNPDRLSRELEKMEPPEDYKYMYGIYLSSVGNAKAVPYLCETVKDIHMVDLGMLRAIGKLGRPIDRGIIMDLPKRVRTEQREEAQKSVEVYLERMKKISNNPTDNNPNPDASH